MKKMVRTGVVCCFMLLSAALGFAAEQKGVPAKPVAPVVKDSGKPAAGTQTKAAPEQGKGAPVDINTATEAELKTIPGIGDTYAKKIIAGRPYAKKDQLKTKKIVPDDVYGKIKDKIIAKQAKK